MTKSIMLKLDHTIIDAIDREVRASNGAYVSRTHLLRQLLYKRYEAGISTRQAEIDRISTEVLSGMGLDAIPED